MKNEQKIHTKIFIKKIVTQPVEPKRGRTKETNERHEDGDKN